MVSIVLSLGLLFGTAYIRKLAKQEKSMNYYTSVLLGGIALLIVPTLYSVLAHQESPGGAIGLVCFIGSIYFIIWSIRKMIGFKKN